MNIELPDDNDRRRIFVLAAGLQFLCGAAFFIDVLSELDGPLLHLMPETMAVVALWVGAAVTLAGLLRALKRTDAVERQLQVASGAFQDVLESRFDAWGLTPSERDVALLSVKGLSIAEIADLRNTREGTIKAQNAAVYRKAGVSGRAELLSVFIEEIAAGLPGGVGAARG